MATGPSLPTSVCARCEEATPAELLTYLPCGPPQRQELVGVCRFCFCLDQVSELTLALPARDCVRETVEESLEQLYLLVRDRHSALVDRPFRDASQAQGEGRGRGQR